MLSGTSCQTGGRLLILMRLGGAAALITAVAAAEGGWWVVVVGCGAEFGYCVDSGSDAVAAAATAKTC